LRHAVAKLLDGQGKLAWAYQEFEAILNAAPPKPRSEPWRRTSDIHQVKKPRNQAVVRELWYARDDLARTTDIAPGRILRDAAMVEAALKLPSSEKELLTIPSFNSRNAFANAAIWFAAIERAKSIPEDDLPETAPKLDALPPPRIWAQRAPDAFARFEAARSAVSTLALALEMPVENLLTPETLRRICWEPPGESATTRNANEVAQFLADRGARQWQIRLTADLIADALLACDELRNT
jgi:ribonuclease D